MTTFAPREYPIAELAIALWSNVPERIQEGDIATARVPYIGIGLKEANLWLWILVEGFTIEQWSRLMDPVYEPFDPTGEYDGSAYTKFDKRRYCIPLDRLKAVYPALDLARARDENDPYQPFFTLDETTGLWLTDITPFTVEGLVFDKDTGVYL